MNEKRHVEKNNYFPYLLKQSIEKKKNIHVYSKTKKKNMVNK